MLTIERTNYAYAEIDASHEEWDGMKAMLKHAVESYDGSDLDYLIPGDAETRKVRLQGLAEKLETFEDEPAGLHKDDLQILLIVASESDRTVNPYLADEQAEEIRNGLGRYNVQTIFDDSLTDESRLAL